jgi:serine/threonine protein kinase
MTAAARLTGLTLNDDWKVDHLIPRAENGTGGMFSHSYLVKKGDRIAFMKAFDFSEAFEAGADTLKELSRLTASYEHERDVLERCRGRRLSHVALAIGYGEVSVPDMGAMEGRVFYLLFEKADGDIRCQMDEADASDVVWCMRAIRQVALALWQVHRLTIAHQDLKPSHVLSYEDAEFKVADFGRSSVSGAPVWHDKYVFPGDNTYAPPELLYGYVHPDFVPRRIGTDLYMLGNLAVFLFTGTNVTASLMARLAPQHHWSRWRSDYGRVLPYLQEAFARVLEELDGRLPDEVRGAVLPLVGQLCNPDLSLRGHPRGIGRYDQYSLERYVSELGNLAQMVEVKARLSRRSA